MTAVGTANDTGAVTATLIASQPAGQRRVHRRLRWPAYGRRYGRHLVRRRGLPFRAPVLGGRRVVAPVVVTGLVLAGGVVAWSATGASAAASYRTATATRGSVRADPDRDGDGHAASAGRPVVRRRPGRCASVAVEVGDHVGIGDTLAVLDRTALRDAVISAKAAVAQAKATLVADTAAQAAAVTAAATPASSGRRRPATAQSSRARNGSSPAAASAATRKTLAVLGRNSRQR